VGLLRSDNYFSSPWDSQRFMELDLLFPGSCSYPEADGVEPWPPLFFCFRILVPFIHGSTMPSFSLRLPTKISMFYWIYASSLSTLVLFFLYDLPKILASTTFSIMLLYFFAVNVKVTEIICFQIETEHYLCSWKYLNMN